MLPVHRRAFLRILVAIGVSGLAAEVVFIGFNILNPSRENGTLERMQGETAAAASTYGAISFLPFSLASSPPGHFHHQTPTQCRERRGWGLELLFRWHSRCLPLLLLCKSWGSQREC